jgi:addiction module RelE/StbE family toxin
MAQVIWTPKALDDFESLLSYIAQDAPAAAYRFAQKVVRRVELLADHPLMGSYVAEDSTRTYREIRQGNYRILYRSDADRVYIVAFHHAARLLDTDDLR